MGIKDTDTEKGNVTELPFTKNRMLLLEIDKANQMSIGWKNFTTLEEVILTLQTAIQVVHNKIIDQSRILKPGTMPFDPSHFKKN